jgi:NAD(P)-dependent dehydrogenase (short-subunit alcohol dehydrogenase family)
MIDLNGKLVLITGATGSLGRHVTTAFLEAGATVAGVSRSVRDEDFPRPRFRAFRAELASSAAAQTLVAAVTSRLGRIDALVHLVGGFAGGKHLAETDEAVLEEMLGVNFRSAFYTAKAVLPVMREAGAGRIVMIGSRAALEPPAGAAAYSASKAALLALVRSIAAEYRTAGITANAIVPGTIDTPANRAAMPRADFSTWVEPRRIAEVALWLVSDQAAAVTGAWIPVSGRSA